MKNYRWFHLHESNKFLFGKIAIKVRLIIEVVGASFFLIIFYIREYDFLKIKSKSRNNSIEMFIKIVFF